MPSSGMIPYDNEGRATSDGRSTSVGTLAIDRFLRPVCYQSVPDALYQRLG
ncbi:hypothetical protein [Rhizorhabdus sp.]|uniref:hypothetical protein n=1 Tax=Rhizorhabdus sp. TaxID=1968843 RepID=UPI0025CEFF75|nr:hypothetical protein [Rhizorhabdus sp.]